ncbi:MAG: hypothetical protein JSS93_05010 [Bacteroidetes bacterium]|nr:hypothetical protein [Bacteroidota bacterium]
MNLLNQHDMTGGITIMRLFLVGHFMAFFIQSFTSISFAVSNPRKNKAMLFKWGFKYFSLAKQLVYLREHGIMLGSRMRSGRKVFLYMVKSLFVEVVYLNDSLDREPERLEIFNNLSQLNQYLEREFRTNF